MKSEVCWFLPLHSVFFCVSASSESRFFTSGAFFVSQGFSSPIVAKPGRSLTLTGSSRNMWPSLTQSGQGAEMLQMVRVGACVHAVRWKGRRYSWRKKGLMSHQDPLQRLTQRKTRVLLLEEKKWKLSRQKTTSSLLYCIGLLSR